MKRLLLKLVVSSLLLTTFVNADDIGFSDKILKKGSFVAVGKNKTVWYIQSLDVIKNNKINDAYKLLKYRVCHNEKMKAAVDKGWTFEYIYISLKDKKTVAYKIDTCK